MVQQYHKQANGTALETVKKHSKDSAGLLMYGACFCPFVQRVWIALEVKGIDYQYVEVDPYEKPPELLKVNPRGLVPAIVYNHHSLLESMVMLDYLEEAFSEPNTSKKYTPLLPSRDKPFERYHQRLWGDYVSQQIVPCFYRYLQAQESDKQIQYGKDLLYHLGKVVKEMDAEGPFFAGKEIGWVDIILAPWAFRFDNVLRHYRGFEIPKQGGERWHKWDNAVMNHPSVVATCSNTDLYLDSYDRYAQNVSGTSQVAKAIQAGTPLP